MAFDPIGDEEKNPRHGGETYTVVWIKRTNLGDGDDVGLEVGERFRLEEKNYQVMFLFPSKDSRLYKAGTKNQKIRFKRISISPAVFEAEANKLDRLPEIPETEEFALYWKEGAVEGSPSEETQLCRTNPLTGVAPNGSAGNRR